MTHTVELAQRIEEDGFAVVLYCLDESTVEVLGSLLTENCYAMRNLLALPIVRELATSAPVRVLAEAVLGKSCFAVKATFFNKTQKSNWKVVWHQDLTIMVRERQEVAGFGPWTLKAGIVHVQPPTEVLNKILAIRLHLDECGPDNGPLRVVPGSHKSGRFSSREVAEWQKRSNVVCTIPRGGALLMRPLLLHASSASVAPRPRRVIHLEFTSAELPGGLDWFDHVK